MVDRILYGPLFYLIGSIRSLCVISKHSSDGSIGRIEIDSKNISVLSIGG